MLNQFKWQAQLKTGQIINQFDIEGKEHQFKEVQDKFNDLVYFKIMNEQGIKIGVNLTSGEIHLNDQVIFDNSKKTNIRLIYFSRHIAELNEFKVEKKETKNFIGFQYLDQDNRNHKVLFSINSNNQIGIHE